MEQEPTSPSSPEAASRTRSWLLPASSSSPSNVRVRHFLTRQVDLYTFEMITQDELIELIKRKIISKMSGFSRFELTFFGRVRFCRLLRWWISDSLLPRRLLLLRFRLGLAPHFRLLHVLCNRTRGLRRRPRVIHGGRLPTKQ
jgi:hypothetical protein